MDFGQFQGMITQQANAQNAFNEKMADKTNAFNATEAQKNRDWQKEMANTALQRKMADAEKAGLNPMLAMQATGADTGSGASASANSTPEAADIINAMTSFTTAQMQQQAQIQAASIAAGASIAAAREAAAASRYAADRNYEASKYASDNSWSSSILTQGVKPSGVGYTNNRDALDKFAGSKAGRWTFGALSAVDMLTGVLRMFF